MKVYVISDIVVNDQQKYEEYMKLVTDTINKYGGKYLVRGGEIITRSGDWNPKGRCVVLEFPSIDALNEWNDSPEYQPVKKIRESCSTSQSFIVSSGDLPF